MKKTILVLVTSLIINIIGFSKPIDFKTAQKVALNFFKERIITFNPTSQEQIVVDNHYVLMKNGEPVIYAFNFASGGYILVTADDAVVPVLAYDYTGSFSTENQPPAFTNWIENYKQQIEYVRNNSLVADAEITEMWDQYLNFKGTSTLTGLKSKSMAPLMLSTWNQDKHYNELCPADTAGPGGHAYAGCVATAMAQVMYYYKYPVQGIGSNAYYSDYGYETANFGTTTYQWNAMENHINNLPNPAIAELLYHCGVAVEMNYSALGSGASTWQAAYVLEGNFGYSSLISYDSKGNGGNSTWETKLRNNLDEKMPLVYSGYPSGGGSGHAFNCDGYQGTNYFHFNWGWGGYYDGYFYVSNLNPGTSSFTSGQGAIFNMYPGSNYPYYCSNQKTLTATRGVFEDGSGPDDYTNNNDCQWLISPSPIASSIQLTFDQLTLDNGDDSIIIYDGPTTQANVLAVVKGSSIPSTISSTVGTMLIRFISDNSGVNSGFHCSYKSVAPVYCSGIVNLTSTTGTISDGSGSNDYNNSTYCRWMILPSNGLPVRLSFTSFKTEANVDFVKIYDPSVSQGILLASYSGSTLPLDVISNSGQMYVLFVSNGTNPGEGWEANFTTAVSIEESGNLKSFEIFPNPAQNIINISFSAISEETIHFQLLTPEGRLILENSFNAQQGENNLKYQVSEITGGLYIVKLTGNQTNIAKKVIIE